MPGRVPVWSPYVRGERTPYHDPDRRAILDGLDLTHGGAAVRRAGYEASGFVVRQLIELSGAPAARIVATGGGTRVQPWMQAIADATGLPVEVSAVPEGAALGAAFLGRMAAGLETSIGRRRPVGVDGTRRRTRSCVDRPDAGPLRPIPRAGERDMTASIFEDASMVSTVVAGARRRRIGGLVSRKARDWSRFTSAPTGRTHPIAVYTIAGSVVSLWQLPGESGAGARRTTIAIATWWWS